MQRPQRRLEPVTRMRRRNNNDSSNSSNSRNNNGAFARFDTRI